MSTLLAKTLCAVLHNLRKNPFSSYLLLSAPMTYLLKEMPHRSSAMSKLTISSFVNKKNTTGIYTEQYRLLDIINLVSLSSH